MEKTYKALKMVLLVLVFIALLLGAKRLYDTLGSQVQMDTLMTQPAQTAAAGEEEAAQAETEAASPDMTVYDLEGNAHQLSDFRGKPVILNFWASWCGPCKSEMPDFDEKYQQYGEEIAACIILKQDEEMTVDEVKAFVRGSMAKHKTPSHVLFMDAFPMTASGKIQKFKLRDWAVEHLNLGGEAHTAENA